MTAPAVSVPAVDDRWTPIARRAPQLAATMSRYLDQIAVSLRPASVDATELALRGLATYLAEQHRVRRVRSIGRDHIEGFKTWLAAQPAGPGRTLSARTIRHRLGMLRVFFERIIDWGWDDAPKTCPILQGDLPRVDDPLPKFLDDAAAAALMRAASTAEPLDRLVVEMLARTGLRAGELCALETNAVVRIGASHWLRSPSASSAPTATCPCIRCWSSSSTPGGPTTPTTPACSSPTPADPLDRHHVGRIVRRVGRAAGIGHVHPHQLRHTLATQAVNRGMSLEAIAALLGHRSLRMTLVYARIADRKVAEEYFSVTEQVEALYPPQATHRPSLSKRRYARTGLLAAVVLRRWIDRSPPQRRAQLLERSMEEVRRQSGASTGSLYHHFPAGKSSILEALLAAELEDHHRGILAAIESRDRSDGIRAGVVHFLTWAEQAPARAALLLSLEDLPAAELGEAIRDQGDQFERALDTWLHRALGTDSSPAPVVFAAWIGPAKEYVRLWLHGRFAPTPTQVAPALARAADAAVSSLLEPPHDQP